ncbi:phage head closure protein [Castellaniella hirudinis]|uniref:phage head closure protein n=1 Tax=Castellaniella hirudinis TaxID=1144617 RepID=UPI0039C0B45B
MEAGRLNRKITIQKRTQVQDESGQPKDAWTDVAKLWAWVKTQTGMGSLRNDQAGSVSMSLVAYSFRIRYRPSVTDDMRVVYGGLNFDIKQVRHDLADHDWTDIVCEEGGNDG